MKNAYEILVGKPEGKRPLQRPRCRWDKMLDWIIKEIRWEVVVCIYLAQVGVQGQALSEHSTKPLGSINFAFCMGVKHDLSHEGKNIDW